MLIWVERQQNLMINNSMLKEMVQYYFSCRFLRLLVLLPCILFPLSSSAAAISAENTYLLVVSICPPWEEMSVTICHNNATGIRNSFQERLGIPDENIHSLVNEHATYDGVQASFAWLKKYDRPNARIIIYMNMHGVLDKVDVAHSKYKKHELLVLWTKEPPFTVEAALIAKQWMRAIELRDMLDRLVSEKIVIIDACHSGAAESDLVVHHPLIARLNAREAVIVSAKPEQLAFVNAEGMMAMFTGNLMAAKAKAPNLEEAFAIARSKTIADATARCSRAGHENDPVNKCRQTPVKADPEGILRTVTFRP